MARLLVGDEKAESAQDELVEAEQVEDSGVDSEDDDPERGVNELKSDLALLVKNYLNSETSPRLCRLQID